MNNQQLINQTLQKHLQSNVEHFADNISTPQTYFFLSMLFLQSVGFVEQKISCIVWELGYKEHLERYKVFKDYGMESIEYEKLNKLYRKLVKNDNSEFKIEVASDLDSVEKIIKYSSSLFEELEYNLFILKNKPNKHLKQLITDLREQRNYIAHFKSFYPDKSIISFCAEDENNINIRFEEFLLYLAVLIKLDEKFIEVFKDYEKNS